VAREVDVVRSEAGTNSMFWVYRDFSNSYKGFDVGLN